jgi:hypothetical protein
MYAYTDMDFIAESQYDTIKDGYMVLSIVRDMERLRHRIYNIISQRYANVDMRWRNELKSDFKKYITSDLSYIHNFTKFLS